LGDTIQVVESGGDTPNNSEDFTPDKYQAYTKS
jgi:hypothetical protein